ncbi:MAG: thermonuclease family protein [Alphaproteobacteria bacterium]|nr:MAG: thermonuclease family protein [Alphaproteobacteria bacterium]
MSREALALAAGLLVSLFASAQEVTGKVVGVYDGDTLTVLTGAKQRVSVRLADIDAPELRQPFGRAAKRELSDLCFNRTATVEARTVDRYGRMVGVVSCEGNDASRSMVERGMAWAYPKYLKRPELAALEEAAKGKHAGLWSQPAVAPWDYRKQVNAVFVAGAASAPASAASGPVRAAQVGYTGPRGGRYVVNAAGRKE